MSETAWGEDVAWGEPEAGVRFGIRRPTCEAEAGGTVVVELVAENVGERPAQLFGFQPSYPRSLRVSPPKEDRPWIRVSFGDVNVFHPPEAFFRLDPGTRATTGLDLSFAFDRRGVGRWPLAFAYEPPRAAGGLTPWQPGAEAGTPRIDLVVGRARTLREAGIDPDLEAVLDEALLRGSPDLVDRLRSLGEGGAHFAARRVARLLSPSAESLVGWRALDALALLGAAGRLAIRRALEDLPHAETALRYADDWVAHRLGQGAPAAHMPFVSMLERLSDQADGRGNFILGWTPYDTPGYGMRRLEIFGNGDRVVLGRAPGDAVTSTRRSALDPMRMDALLKALRYAAVWLLRPLRETGLPDEPRPALEVQLALGVPFQRQVAMWNGEWRHGPASNLADLLDRLAAEGLPDTLRPPPA